MKNSFLKISSVVMYFMSFTGFLLLIGADTSAYTLTVSQKTVTASFIVLTTVFGTAMHCKVYHSAGTAVRAIRYTVKILAFVYLVLLIDFTLIDSGFGRDIEKILTWNRTAFSEYIDTYVNPIPFATVRLFAEGYANGTLSWEIFAENILGNFAAFMPCAVFLPVLLKSARKFSRYMLTVTACVLVIEILQFLFRTGSADIDDLILNASGAALMYGIFSIKKIHDYLKDQTYGVWCLR